MYSDFEKELIALHASNLENNHIDLTKGSMIHSLLANEHEIEIEDRKTFMITNETVISPLATGEVIEESLLIGK